MNFSDIIKKYPQIEYDPLFFLSLVNKTKEDKGDMLLFSKWQISVCEYLTNELKDCGKNKNIFIAIAGGRGCGKTTLASFLASWWVACHKKNNTGVRLFANTEEQTKKVLFGTCQRIFDKLDLNFLLEIANKSQIVCRENPKNDITTKTWNKSNNHDTGSVRGEHFDYGLRVFDESSSIPDPVLDAIFTGLTSGVNITILLGNPYSKLGTFYNIFKGDNPYNFYTKHVSLFDCDHIDTDSDSFKKYVKSVKSKDISGDLYRVEVLGEFPLSNEAIFFPQNIKINEIDFFQLPALSGVIGIDIATFEGDDMTVISQFLDGKLYIHFWGKKRITDLAQEIANIYTRNKTICVDVVGVGQGLKDILLDRGIYIKYVIGNETSGTARYFNKKAELHGKLRDFFLQQGEVYCTSEIATALKQELSWIIATFDTTGRIKMCDKTKMPRSPDIVDSLTYCFADSKQHSDYTSFGINNVFSGW